MIGKVFADLYDAYGDQNWWPAETPFEVMVGAILTQNTSWENVEKAIEQLKQNHVLTAEKIAEAPQEQLAEWVRSSGYYNIKAEYLKNYSKWYLAKGGLEALSRLETDELREELLALKGIGEETADDILLYAFDRPVFVIDEYTRRLFYRLGVIAGDESYDELSHIMEISLDWDAELFNEYHALIVKHSKEHCRKEPICKGCPLDSICPDDE